MAEYLVLSDSHRAEVFLRRAADRFLAGNFDGAIHLGDCACDARRFGEWTGCDVISVAGNCDLFSAPSSPRERIEVLGGLRALICHGDRYRVKSSLTALSYRAEELRCDIALFGHTHRAFSGYVGRALLMNPGALQDGRFAVLRVSDNGPAPALLTL